MTDEQTKTGRPTIYTQELADELCEYLAMGESLRTACGHEGMPAIRTVFNWMHKNDSFMQQYARAKQESADAMAEEILDISDKAEDVIKHGAEKKSGAYAQTQRLRVDTRKWLMSKMKPKKYGEKVDVTSGGQPLPLLGGITNVPVDDGDEETGEVEETD